MKFFLSAVSPSYSQPLKNKTLNRYSVTALFIALFCAQSHAMFLSKRIHTSGRFGKSSYHFKIEKLDKKRTVYEIILLNRELLKNNKFLNPKINHAKNNNILTEHGFPSIDNYINNLPLYLHEYLDALIEIHDKYLHRDWHFGYLANSYNGAFAEIFASNEIKGHVETLMKTMLEHYPSNANEDWELLVTNFLSLYQDESCFKFYLRNSMQKEFQNRFIKADFPLETFNRMPKAPSHAGIKFHVRENMKNNLSEPNDIKNLVSQARKIVLDEEKN